MDLSFISGKSFWVRACLSLATVDMQSCINLAKISSGTWRPALNLVIWYSDWNCELHLSVFCWPLSTREGQYQWLTRCYRLDICILPKFIGWNLIPKEMLFGGGTLGGDQVEAESSQTVSGPLWKGSQRVPWPPFCHVRSPREDAWLWTRKLVFTR